MFVTSSGPHDPQLLRLSSLSLIFVIILFFDFFFTSASLPTFIFKWNLCLSTCLKETASFLRTDASFTRVWKPFAPCVLLRATSSQHNFSWCLHPRPLQVLHCSKRLFFFPCHILNLILRSMCFDMRYRELFMSKSPCSIFHISMSFAGAVHSTEHICTCANCSSSSLADICACVSPRGGEHGEDSPGNYKTYPVWFFF